ncbi:N-acetyltransferase [Bacillus sp. 165]|uniref:GNAT family N-acetyltransferase n=1 Tax=Bacillus sp. 165 TaxID=1529117 RepID=UPI001ADB1721|nr:N-acetyltransferase [Bacillus sp. 165]MBO9128106.1 N-acetyltransferase [Bacillus sp. 165]
MEFIIRQERTEDYSLTENVVERAFADAEHSDHNEHKLVSRIRKSNAFIPSLSLVAVDQNDDKIVGHILLSKLKIRNENRTAESLALAPVSVIPEYQNRGVGKQLIHAALQQAKKMGYESVVVLGHPPYYPKFGFKKASLWGIQAPFEVPDEAFMAMELQEGALGHVSGLVEYPSVFFE